VNLEQMNTDLNISAPSYSYTALGSKIEKNMSNFFIQRFFNLFYFVHVF